jgi:GT2 family glycosyltransferase
MTTLSIIIVHYKTPALLEKCVASIFATTPSDLVEVIVVDNNSKDDSKGLILQEFPQVQWSDSGYNAGFARANNSGIRMAKGEYIVLLNPDTYVTEYFFKKWLEKYKEMDQNHQLGLLGCRIISSVDNSLLVGTGRGFPSWKKYLNANPVYVKFAKKRPLKKYDAQEMHYQNHEADFMSGACVMIKKSKIEQHNLYLDEDFFLYSEDVEWSFRVKKKGYFNYFCADVEVFHVNSASTGQSDNKKKIMFVSELLYLYKTHTKLQFWLFQWLFRFNFLLNKWLLTRSGELDKLEIEKMYKSVFDKFLPRIKKGYKRIPSSAKEYVRYLETH